MDSKGTTTLLHTACQAGNEKMVKFLVGEGANPNITQSGRRLRFTTMHWAAWHGNLKIIKLLTQHKFNYRLLINNIINIPIAPYNMMSVFLILCSNGNVECMEYLYSNFGKLIETRTSDSRGCNAIYLAVAKQHLTMLQYLFAKVYTTNPLKHIMANNTKSHSVK